MCTCDIDLQSGLQLVANIIMSGTFIWKSGKSQGTFFQLFGENPVIQSGIILYLVKMVIYEPMNIQWHLS